MNSVAVREITRHGPASQKMALPEGDHDCWRPALVAATELRATRHLDGCQLTNNAHPASMTSPSRSAERRQCVKVAARTELALSVHIAENTHSPPTDDGLRLEVCYRVMVRPVRKRRGVPCLLKKDTADVSLIE